MNIIAYGSLMNNASLEKTLKRAAELYAITVPGYCRVFNAPFDGYAFLNLAADQNSTIEGAYFELKESELKLFSVREAGSSLVEIVPGYFAFTWPANNCQELPVLSSYISVCRDGANELGLNFDAGLQAPTEIIDDSARPLYGI